MPFSKLQLCFIYNKYFQSINITFRVIIVKSTIMVNVIIIVNMVNMLIIVIVIIIVIVVSTVKEIITVIQLIGTSTVITVFMKCWE